MATRRTVASLAEEFASLRGVSQDSAIRIALTEAIARENEPVWISKDTEALAEELAELLDLTPPEAIHFAVNQMIEKPNYDPFSTSAMEAIGRRVNNAFMDGRDYEAGQIWMHVESVAFVSIGLIVVGSLLGGGPKTVQIMALLVVVVLAALVSFFVYGRRLTKERRSRELSRAQNEKSIADLIDKLPDGLEFLSSGPTWLDPLDSTEDD